jgi:predicted MFS family arabinose efflux permease
LVEVMVTETKTDSWWATAAGCAVVIALCYGFARYAYGPFVPRFSETFGLTPVGVGVLSGLSTAGYGLGLLLAPRTSARSARGTVLLAAVSATLGLGLMALAPHVTVFGAGIVVAGAGAGLVSPGVAQLIGETVAARTRARAQTWANTGTGLGLAASAFTPLLALGWPVIWSAFAALGVLVTAIAWRTLPRSGDPADEPAAGSVREAAPTLPQPGAPADEPAARPIRGAARTLPRSAGPTREATRTLPQPGAPAGEPAAGPVRSEARTLPAGPADELAARPIREAAPTLPQPGAPPSEPAARPIRRAAPLVVNSVLIGVTSAPYWTFSTSRLAEAGLDPVAATWCWAAIGVAGLLGGLAGRAAERAGLRAVNLITWTLSAAGLALLALPRPGVPLALLSSALFGGTYMALTGLCILWAARLSPARPARGITWSFAGLGVGQTVASPLAGALAAGLGSTAVFGLTALLALTAWSQLHHRLGPP